MPSITDSTAAAAAARPRPRPSIDNYFLDEDFDDPFASPSPGGGKNKRKGPEGLGIDEEVEVKKRAREPRVKLDEARLLSENGIPKLRRKAKDLKFKGKGHEFSDAARLLSFYQLWLDDLFPKAKFLDALAMVEKAGHKTSMQRMRMEWINEGKPKTTADEDHDDEGIGRPADAREVQTEREATRLAPIFEKTAAAQRQDTGAGGDDPFASDEDIYAATPRRVGLNNKTATTGPVSGKEAPDDDLDALLAEAQAQQQQQQVANSGFGGSFLGSKPRAAPGGQTDDAPDDGDDLDAMLAEAEAQAPGPTKRDTAGALVNGSIFGGPRAEERPAVQEDADDLEALIAEAETVEAAGGEMKVDAGRTPAPVEEVMEEMDGLW